MCNIEQFFDKYLEKDACCKQHKISISIPVNLSNVSGSTMQDSQIHEFQCST
jgi:hypothetical protein